MEATNTLDFCISCHEMEFSVYQEYRHTAHFSNPAGIQAACPDCHVPREWSRKLVRKIKASREVFYWITGAIDTPAKFEAKRLELAERVWHSMVESDSRECRNCHTPSVMDLDGQARFAARIHTDAIERNDTCIDCHKGIAHQLPRGYGESPSADTKMSRDDLEYGEEINETCAGCHGEFGQGTLDGEYPRLAGLDSVYILKQIEHFKSRERLNIPMLPYATDRELPNEDTEIIAGYLSAIDLPTSLPPVDENDFNAYRRLQNSKQVLNIPIYQGNSLAGNRIYDKECAGCHGDDGYGDRGRSIPQLTGQHSIYLKRQVEKFRTGGRLHDDPRDAEIFQSFGDGEIDDILAYLSILDDDQGTSVPQ